MMISNMHLTLPTITYDEEDGFVVVMTKTPEASPVALPEEKPRAKSLTANKFKKAVFRVVEHNEEHKHDADEHCEHKVKGYADIESVSGDFRYKIGIIDFLTNYNSSKYLENQFKSKIHHVERSSVSAIDSSSYQKRFVKFMSDNF